MEGSGSGYNAYTKDHYYHHQKTQRNNEKEQQWFPFVVPFIIAF